MSSRPSVRPPNTTWSSTITPEKTHEIAAGRELCRKVDFNGKLVRTDVIHTPKETSPVIDQEFGGDYP